MGSVIELLQIEARRLPPRLGDAARFVATHPFDAATTPMRALAQKAGHPPATFTRLAQALGHAGWEGLREQLVELARREQVRGPFSGRPLPFAGAQSIGTGMLSADIEAIAATETRHLNLAAALIEAAPRVFVAGFRSCYAPAYLFNYLYRLFRPEVTLIGGAGGVLDLEISAFRRDDVVVVICFDPYSRDALLTAQAARAAGCVVIAVVDSETAPIATEATQVLLYSTASPGFFPSLTACVALLQALAALLYVRSGPPGRKRLRETEARIQAHTPYLASERSDT